MSEDSGVKIHEIKERKLERLRFEKNLLANTLNAGSFGNNHDKDLEEFYRSRAERMKKRHQNRRNLGSIKREKQRTGIKGEISRQGKRRATERRTD